MSTPKGEFAFIEWLRQQAAADPARVPIGIGDDMAAIAFGAGCVLVTADMLLDGVHFDTAGHTLEQIGRKAMACSLSDCAAMACRPRGAVISVALPNTMTMDEAKQLASGLLAMGRQFDCPLVGGDTTSWNHPLAIDVSMLAEPMVARGPVRRDGARPGDELYVTGPLGGSLLGRHLAFTPRLAEAEAMVTRFGDAVHAMIDISDGLVTDGLRVARASGCIVQLDAACVEAVVSDDARDAARRDGRPAIEHALHDGEDFELLVAMAPDAAAAMDQFAQAPTRIGTVRPLPPDGPPQVWLRHANGVVEPVEPKGYEHFR